jgi:competence protein ComEC
MIAVAMVAVIQQHNTSPFNVLAVAFFAVLVVDPFVVLSAGLWLSFIAVSPIIYVIAGRLGKSGLMCSVI